jgi:hypothetical protein
MPVPFTRTTFYQVISMTLPTHSIPVERLWELYDFNPLTGQLISKRTDRPVKPSNQGRQFKINVRHEGKPYSTNLGRVVFAWVKGNWPANQVDHIDRDFTNNRHWNLRDVDCRTNIQNRSTSQRGLYYEKNGWRAVIYVEGQRKYLGRHETREEAQAAYNAELARIGVE